MPSRVPSGARSLPNLVASTTSSRRPAMARPTSCSLVNGPYMSAVSRKVTPRSRARWMVAMPRGLVGRAVELRHPHAAEAEGRDSQCGAGVGAAEHTGGQGVGGGGHSSSLRRPPDSATRARPRWGGRCAQSQAPRRITRCRVELVVDDDHVSVATGRQRPGAVEGEGSGRGRRRSAHGVGQRHPEVGDAPSHLVEQARDPTGQAAGVDEPDVAALHPHLQPAERVVALGQAGGRHGVADERASGRRPRCRRASARCRRRGAPRRR